MPAATKTKQLTPTAAADQWKEAKRELDQVQGRLKAAEGILKEHFQKTGKQKFRGIGYSQSSRLMLDNAKVKAELGDRLPDFQKRVPIESLSLLED